jgi:N-dimethylarginine dimethylaminohydrolase
MTEAAPKTPTNWKRTVLMGDPSHFSVKGGANPHTRTWLGTRRSVDRARAVAQWQKLRDALREHGVRVVVVPPDPGQPGLVYPANAGFLPFVDAEKPIFEKTFHLSNLIATRAGERFHYERVIRSQGMRTSYVPEHLRFEGEADFFPVADHYVLTHGRLENQRFVPRVGIPPWKRIYGFRTDARVESLLAPLVAPRPVLTLELVREAHYHGDTALCAFGHAREHLLVWRPALADESWSRLRETLGAAALLELSDEDAARYAANAFPYTPSGQTGAARESFLFLPDGVSDRLLGQIRERGVSPVCVDVSEFLKKGGGSVKCMIGDLGVFEGPVARASMDLGAAVYPSGNIPPRS